MSGGRPQLVPYDPRWREAWDEFVRGSRNGHFMIERGYLEYHADRFEDSSLLFFHKGRLVALLPAHRKGEELMSYGGLPFAGFVVAPRTGHGHLAEIFAMLPQHLRDHGVARLIYTPTPSCYHAAPFEDDIYLMHRAGARCVSIKLSAGFAGPVPQAVARRMLRRLQHVGRTLPCEFFETEDVPAFWEHLERFLQARRETRPVHTAAEMALLKSRFPDQIRLFLARAAGEIVGGELLYLTPRVQRCQYSFRHRSDSTAVSRRLTLWLAAQPDLTRPWTDLGTSVHPGTGELDDDLYLSKENTGARGTIVQTWIWEFA